MGSRPTWSTSFGARALGAFALHITLLVSPARAQHADAGVEHAARPPTPAESKPPADPSGVLPKTIDPSVLSEGVQAGLQERMAGKHPAGLPSASPVLRTEPSVLRDPTLSGGLPPTPAPRHGLVNEPLRRGEAHLRRVQAVDTGKGVTLLSNRIQPPADPRLASLVARAARERGDEPLADEAVAATGEPPGVTETHSLLPISSRTVNPRSSGTGLGWLVWPFVLFVGAGAVVGTLWFRKKVE